MTPEPQLFSIGEFSQISGLSVKALLFYHENGLLKPAQVDPSSGYRYYDAASAERARIIRRLRELRFSLGRHLMGKPLCLYYDGEYRDEDANFEPCFPLRQAPSAAPRMLAVGAGPWNW